MVRLHGREGTYLVHRIFICYREDDTKERVRSLRESLQKKLPPGSDCQAPSVPASNSVSRAMIDEVRGCTIFLAVIGEKWQACLEARTSDGCQDYVVDEIKAALGSGKVVLPVLLGDAEMPSARKLPEVIRSFVDNRAMRVNHEDANSVAELAGFVHGVLAKLDGSNDLDQNDRRTERRARTTGTSRRDAAPWRYLVLLLAVVGFSLVAFRLGASVGSESAVDDEVAITAPSDAGVLNVWAGARKEAGRRERRDRFVFPATVASTKDKALVLRHGEKGVLRLQYANAVRHGTEGGYRLAVPSVDRFVVLNERKTVGVLLPCDPELMNGCSRPGQSLSRGARLANTKDLNVVVEVHRLPPELGRSNPGGQDIATLVEKFAEKPAVALLMGYNSSTAHHAIDSCARPRGSASRCGPVFVFASATSLRAHFDGEEATAGYPWLFRMTPDNRVRAQALAERLDDTRRVHGESEIGELQIVYEDDHVEGDPTTPENRSYALDQMQNLRDVLSDADYKNAYRVAFRRRHRADPSEIEFRGGHYSRTSARRLRSQVTTSPSSRATCRRKTRSAERSEC